MYTSGTDNGLYQEIRLVLLKKDKEVSNIMDIIVRVTIVVYDEASDFGTLVEDLNEILNNEVEKVKSGKSDKNIKGKKEIKDYQESPDNTDKTIKEYSKIVRIRLTDEEKEMLYHFIDNGVISVPIFKSKDDCLRFKFEYKNNFSEDNKEIIDLTICELSNEYDIKLDSEVQIVITEVTKNDRYGLDELLGYLAVIMTEEIKSKLQDYQEMYRIKSRKEGVISQFQRNVDFLMSERIR